MRLGALVVVVMLVQAGCTDNSAAPPNLDQGVLLDEGPGDGLPGGSDGSGGGVDLAPIRCKTACDCPDGQRCNAGACEISAPMVFCCGKATCPGDSLCQQPNGEVSQCSLPPDAGVKPSADGGATCATTSCAKGTPGDILCELSCGTTTAKCVAGGSGAHCTP